MGPWLCRCRGVRGQIAPVGERVLGSYVADMSRLWRAILRSADGFITVGKTAKGVGYVSVWVLIWGTAASLVDYILLKREIYASFSIGQGFTFVGYGVAAAYLAVKLAPRFLKQEEPPAAD